MTDPPEPPWLGYSSLHDDLFVEGDAPFFMKGYGAKGLTSTEVTLPYGEAPCQ